MAKNKNKNKNELLKKAQNEAKKARNRMANLQEALQLELKDKDANTAAKVYKEFQTQITQLQASVSKCNKECNQLQAQICREKKGKTFPKKSKRQEKKEKLAQVKAQPKTQTPPATENKPQTSLSQIRILSWQTDLEGAALREKLVQTNVDIVLLQGTSLGSLLESLSDGYKSYHEPGNNGAIVLRKNIPAEEISQGQDQVQSLLIKLEKEFLLTNVANPTSSSFDPKMLSGIHERHLIGGDFESGETKFREDHMYKIVPSAMLSNKRKAKQQKHNFFLISPQLMPDFLSWRNRLMTEDEGSRSPLLFPPRSGVPIKGTWASGEKQINEQLRKRLFEENLDRLGRNLRGVIRERFINLWRTQRTQSLQLPLFPQDIKVPVDELESSMEYWERLWKENVDKIHKWNVRRGLVQKRPPKTADESSALTSGIVTQVLSTCGYLFAKDYGKVYIPLKAVMRPTANIYDMQLYLRAGDSVKFRAIPQGPKNNCQWAATYVEVRPETDIDPDILRDKTGVVVKIADNGTYYALIESEEHGTVFCPGSACVSQLERGKRLNEVFQVGDKVQFTAHVQPEKTGIRWFAVTATKLEQECSAPMAWPQQNPQSAGLEHETRSSTTGLARKRPWQSQEESAVPPKIASQEQAKQVTSHSSSLPPTRSQGLQQEQQDEQSKTVWPQPWPSLDQGSTASESSQEQLSRWERLAPLVLKILKQPHQVPSLPSHTTQTLDVHGTVLNVSSPQPWPSPDPIGHSSNRIQRSLQLQQMQSQTTQTVDVPGMVLNVSSGCAIVATDNLGHVVCPLSSWTSSNVRHQQTTSLLDVLAIGDLVQIRATRDAPWQAWRAVVLCYK